MSEMEQHTEPILPLFTVIIQGIGRGCEYICYIDNEGKLYYSSANDCYEDCGYIDGSVEIDGVTLYYSDAYHTADDVAISAEPIEPIEPYDEEQLNRLNKIYESYSGNEQTIKIGSIHRIDHRILEAHLKMLQEFKAKK